MEKFFGPPNYGENPESDQIEQATILRLDRPLMFRKSDGASLVVDEVQLVLFPQMIEGMRLNCEGLLAEAETGHHRRDVLLDGR